MTYRIAALRYSCDESGTLDKAAFNACVRALVPGESLSAEEMDYLSFVFSNAFYAFDRDGSGEVDADEVGAGLLLFASGSKSDKLAICFDSFSSRGAERGGDVRLSRREMFLYLRSFLTVLASLTEAGMEMP